MPIIDGIVINGDKEARVTYAGEVVITNNGGHSSIVMREELDTGKASEGSEPMNKENTNGEEDSE